jgi:hypothetical protein
VVVANQMRTHLNYQIEYVHTYEGAPQIIRYHRKVSNE